MTYFLIFVAVAVAAAAALYVVGLNRGEPDAAVYADALAAPVANLPPVLLPGKPEPADVDKLRFSLGLRGYRMDQVDEALDRLRDELTAKNERIRQLEAGSGAPETLVASDATDVSQDSEASEAVGVPSAAGSAAWPAGEEGFAPGEDTAGTSLNG